MTTTRRHVLVASTAGLAGALWLRPAHADAAELAAAIAAFAGGAPVKAGRVKLDIAPLVENGNAVPVSVAVESPMSAADHVKAIAIFNERNPQRDVAVFHLGARAGRAEVSTRIRLATSQQLVAIAQMSDGSCWTHTVDVIVTLAACVEVVGNAMARTLVTMPKTAKRGEVIEIRTLIAHPMETGYRSDEGGAILPRNLIRHLSCRYFDGQDDVEVFSADLFPAVAANPYIAFFTVATASGVLRFNWQGDNGFTQTESVNLTVT